MGDSDNELAGSSPISTEQANYGYDTTRMLLPDVSSGDYLRRSFTIIPDVEVEVTTGPEIYRGKYRFDLYTSQEYLRKYDYNADFQNQTINVDQARRTFSITLGRVNQFSETLAAFKNVITQNPDKKFAFVLLHGETDGMNGRWKLDAETPSVYADPVIFQIAEKANDNNYAAVFMAACNPGGIKVNMEDVPIPVFATIGDNTVKGCPLAMYSPS